MKTTTTLILASAFVLNAKAQLAPTTPAPLSAHLLEVNKEWRNMDPTPVGGDRIVRFDNDAQRIAEHLHRVAAFLRAHAPEGLSADASAQRVMLLEKLEAYADRGLFPQNTVLPYRNPVFIDPRGTACAVGQLMIESDARALAESVSAEMNLAYVHEMHRADVAAWAVAHGFTEDELAWIQPGYSPNHDWFPLGGGTDGEVTTLLKLSNGDLLVAGQFASAGGVPCTQVARWNGSNYQNMGAGVIGYVTCAIEFGGDIYLGGSFQAGYQDLAHWVGTAWLYENAFIGKVVQVNDLHEFNGSLYAAGYGAGFAGASHQVLKKVGTAWQPLGVNWMDFNSEVLTLEDHYGQLVCGGAFTEMGFFGGGPAVAHVAVIDSAGDWTQLADGLDASVNDLHSFNLALYAGGEMRIDTLPAFGLARLGDDVAVWEQLMPNQISYAAPFNGECRINTVGDAGGELFIGGAFIMPGLMFFGNNLARFNGAPDAFDAWALNDGAVRDMAALNDQLVIGGAFQNDTGDPVPYIGYTDLPSGIGEGPSDIGFTLAPNPVGDQLTISLPNNLGALATIAVLDATGRRVIAPRQVSGVVAMIDVNALAAGSYLVELRSGGRITARPFMKH